MIDRFRKELYDNLDKYWQQVVDELVQSLKDVGRYASGVTAQSIGENNVNPVAITSNGFKIVLGMPEYFEFIDEGVSGAKNNTNRSRFKYTDKMPPIKAIRRFMINRGIVPKNFTNIKNRSGTKAQKAQSIEQALNGLAFAIARKIYENGVEKTNFYSNVVNDTKLLDFETRLLDFYSKFIIDTFMDKR